MTNLVNSEVISHREKNLINLATQAAENEFLWELGMRVQSGSQARDICQKLSVPLADEKRVKAVFRLRIENPEILQKIRDDAVDEGDKEMVEVVTGPKHFNLISEDKDKGLWGKIMSDFNIALYGTSNAKTDIFAYVESSADFQTSVKIWKSKTVTRSKPLIDIWPVPEQRQPQEGTRCNFFYCPRNGPGTINVWRSAIFSVNDKNFFSLAKRLAHAYEAETARRRKPAKAVVLKNY